MGLRRNESFMNRFARENEAIFRAASEAAASAIVLVGARVDWAVVLEYGTAVYRVIEADAGPSRAFQAIPRAALVAAVVCVKGGDFLVVGAANRDVENVGSAIHRFIEADIGDDSVFVGISPSDSGSRLSRCQGIRLRRLCRRV